LRLALRAPLLLLSTLLGSAALSPTSLGQDKPAPPTPAIKNPRVGPPAPQSKHYPILLLAFGNAPNWSVRIGLKGPERLDRPGYPPIPLEPAEVTNEATPETWTYRAKDSATGAAVTLHLSREACTDATNDTLTATPPLGGKYSFKAFVEHAQVGSMKGCARIATELFPKINNQPDPEEEEAAKKKPPASTVTNFKAPVAVAYLNAKQQLVFKRGAVARIASPQRAYQYVVSHDGKKLLFAQIIQEPVTSSVSEYNFDTGQTKELLRGKSLSAFWSPDDTVVALQKQKEDSWESQVWTFPAGAPEKTSLLYTSEDIGFSLRGWADGHTFFAIGKENFYWVGDDGAVKQTIPITEVCGTDSFSFLPQQQSFAPNPINPDLLLVEATLTNPPVGAPTDPQTKTLKGFLLYEVRSKRRSLLSATTLNAWNPVWSQDGLQVFFTGQEPGKAPAVYRIFWDGLGLQRYASGTAFVVGQ
jgi:uncharacterized membrane protein